MTQTVTVTRMVASSAAMVAGAAGAASAQDIAGPYAGVTLGTASGDYQWSGDYNLEGSALGGFTGYNFVNGNMVYGAELAFNGPVETDIGSDFGIDQMIDLKGRLGVVTGNTLFYGTLGFSSVDFTHSNVGSSTTGTLVGAGVEMGFGGNAFVGLEVLSRDFADSGDFLGNGPASMVSTAIRIGLRF